jgi:glycosyltransferase involved in cell wall biosynthesis
MTVSRLGAAGGRERCVIDLSDALYDCGWRPVIISFREIGIVTARLRHREIPIRPLKKRPGYDWSLPARLASIFREERISIVHSHNWGTQVEALLAAAFAGVPSVVHTQHGLEFGVANRPSPFRERFRNLAKRISSRRLRRIAAVSQEVREVILRDWKAPPDRVALIHNGIRLPDRGIDPAERVAGRAALGIGPQEQAVLAVGVLRPVKAFHVLLEAFSIYSTVHTNARLFVAGDGPLRAELEANAQRLGLGDRASFLGIRQDVETLLPLFDLYAMSSVSEGLSISILEAMAAGLPVVATRVGGNPEVVADGTTGLLVPPGDPRALADAIGHILCCPARARAMGVEGRTRVRAHFSLSQMASAYERLYEAAR